MNCVARLVLGVCIRLQMFHQNKMDKCMHVNDIHSENYFKRAIVVENQSKYKPNIVSVINECQTFKSNICNDIML